MNSPRRLLLPAVVVVAVLAAFSPAARPRDRAARAGDTSVKVPDVPLAAAPARLRLWKTELPDASDVCLLWTEQVASTDKTHSAPKPREIARASAGFQFGEYVGLPAGRGTLHVEAGAHHFDDVAASLPAGSFHTLLITGAGAELISDDPVIEAGTGDFTLRNLTPDARTLTLKVGEEVTARFPRPGGLLRMRGLRAGVYAIRTEGTDAAGKPFDWTVESDFTRSPRQTLLIYPDAYGRIRPRLSVDGPGMLAEAGN